MAQKTLPISLRLYKNKNWEFEGITDKKDFFKFFYLNLEIKQYFFKFFKNEKIKLINLKCFQNSDNVYIYLVISKKIKLNKKIKKNLKFLKEKLIFILPGKNIKFFTYTLKINRYIKLNKKIRKFFNFIRKNRKRKFDKKIKKSLYIFLYAFYVKQIDIILLYILQKINKKRNFLRIFKKINNYLKLFFFTFKNLIGYRLQIKGRIKKSKRKKKQVFQKGKLSLNTLNTNVKYVSKDFNTSLGSNSIKLWVYFKK